MTGTAASGIWKNYHMASEHMHITSVFLNNFIEMVNFLCHHLQGNWKIVVAGSFEMLVNVY
jgi:hypothetical protein